MLCKQCNKDMPIGVKFCPECGSTVDEVSAPIIENAPVNFGIKAYASWLVAFTVIYCSVRYRPPSLPFLTGLSINVVAGLATAAIINAVVFSAACVGGLFYKATGKHMPWQKIRKVTWIASVVIGCMLLYGLNYSNSRLQ